MKIMLVINPVAGDRDKVPFLEEAKTITDRYGIDLKLFNTEPDTTAEDIYSAVKGFKPDRVGAVGGDGTVLLTALGLRESACPMGIVPMGSANGLAKELGVAQLPKKAFLDLLTTQRQGGLDMLCINQEHYTLHLGDVGANAQVVKKYEHDAGRGMAAYAKHLFEVLSELEAFGVEVKTKENSYYRKAVMVALCNARKYGTGIPLNLQGNPMDGQFEIVIIEEVNVNSLIQAGLSKFDENFYDQQNNEVISTQWAKLRFDSPRLLQLDGEVIGELEELEVEIVSDQVQLLYTNENPYFEGSTAD